MYFCHLTEMWRDFPSLVPGSWSLSGSAPMWNRGRI